MIYLTFFLYFLLFLSLVRNSARLGPMLLVSVYSFVSIVVFYLNDYGVVYFEPYKGLPLPMYGDYLYADQAYTIASIFALMCIVMSFRYRKVGGGGDLSEYVAILLAMRHKPRFVIFNYLFLSVFILLYVWNIYEVNFDIIFSNTSYLFNVDPVRVGVTSSLGRIVYHAIGPISLVFAFMLAYYVKAKRYDMFFLVLLLLFYSMFIKSAQFSRWLPLIFVALAMSIFMVFESRRKYIFIFLSILASLFCFILVLKGRGGFEQGFDGFVLQMEEFSFADISYLSKLVVNVFGGYISYAESLEKGWVYDTGYIIRSFSPFPSFIDGWGQYAGDVGRVNKHSPFNFFSEVYFFGKGFGIGLAVMFFLSLSRIEYLHRMFFSMFSIIGFIVFVYVFLAVFFYPVRNVFRLYLICMVLYEFSAYIAKSKRRKLKKINKISLNASEKTNV